MTVGRFRLRHVAWSWYVSHHVCSEKPLTYRTGKISMNDTEFMRIAIEESKKGDWPYGAVIVKDGAIVVKAFNTATRDRDPTAHAEVNVIRVALQVHS